MIIGLTGSICAGTDSFARILKEKDFEWFSYSEILREEAKKRGIEINRKNLQNLGDDMRKEKGRSVLSKLIIDKMVEGKNYVVGDMRNLGEVEEFRKIKGFILVMVDAPWKLRYKRLVKRAREGDPFSVNGFKKLEDKDRGVNQEGCGQQHAKVFEMADKIIINDGSFEELKEKVLKLLEEIKKENV